MLSFAEILSPGNPQKKSVEKFTDEDPAHEQPLSGEAETLENSELFNSAFAAVSPIESDEIETIAAENEQIGPINPEMDLQLQFTQTHSEDDRIAETPISEHNTKHAAPSLLTVEATEPQAVPAPGNSLLSAAIPEPVQVDTDKAISVLPTSTLIHGSADTDIEDGSDVAGSKLPAKDIKPGLEHAASPAQIKWDSQAIDAETETPNRGLENAIIKSAGSNGTTPPPLQTATNTGLQIAPVVSNVPVFVAPPTATPIDITQMSQTAPPSQQVAQALASVTHGQDRVQVRLDPPELGRVTVDFQFDGNRGVTAVISAENADIGAQLRDRSDFFLKSLRLAGFDSVDLSFDTSSHQSQNENSLQHETNASDIEIYRTENLTADIDETDTMIGPRLLMPEDNLNILL